MKTDHTSTTQACIDRTRPARTSRTPAPHDGQLVLGIALGECLVIGPDVVVRVQRIKGNEVRLGIFAPRDVAVHRGEVFLSKANDRGIATPGKAAS